MATNRLPKIPQSVPGSDVTVNDNLLTVVGFNGFSFNGTPVQGSVPVIDPNLKQVNFPTVLPASVIPDVPSYRRLFMFLDGN